MPTKQQPPVPVAPRESTIDRAGAVLGGAVLAIVAPAILLRQLAAVATRDSGAPPPWEVVGVAVGELVRLIALGMLVLILVASMAAAVVTLARDGDDVIADALDPDLRVARVRTAALYGIAAAIAGLGVRYFL